MTKIITASKTKVSHTLARCCCCLPTNLLGIPTLCTITSFVYTLDVAVNIAIFAVYASSGLGAEYFASIYTALWLRIIVSMFIVGVSGMLAHFNEARELLFVAIWLVLVYVATTLDVLIAVVYFACIPGESLKRYNSGLAEGNSVTQITPDTALYTGLTFVQAFSFLFTLLVTVYCWKAIYLMYLTATLDKRPHLRYFIKHEINQHESSTSSEGSSGDEELSYRSSSRKDEEEEHHFKRKTTRRTREAHGRSQHQPSLSKVYPPVKLKRAGDKLRQESRKHSSMGSMKLSQHLRSNTDSRDLSALGGKGHAPSKPSPNLIEKPKSKVSSEQRMPSSSSEENKNVFPPKRHGKSPKLIKQPILNYYRKTRVFTSSDGYTDEEKCKPVDGISKKKDDKREVSKNTKWPWKWKRKGIYENSQVQSKDLSRIGDEWNFDTFLRL